MGLGRLLPDDVGGAIMLCRLRWRMVSAIAPVAVSSQGWVLVVVVVVILAGLVYGFYTRSGSGISEHPLGVSDEAPGAEGRSEVSGKDEGEGSTFDTHGT